MLCALVVVLRKGVCVQISSQVDPSFVLWCFVSELVSVAGGGFTICVSEKEVIGIPAWATSCYLSFNPRCVISGQTPEVRKPLFASCFLSVMSPRMQAAARRRSNCLLCKNGRGAFVVELYVCVSAISVFTILG